MKDETNESDPHISDADRMMLKSTKFWIIWEAVAFVMFLWLLLMSTEGKWQTLFGVFTVLSFIVFLMQYNMRKVYKKAVSDHSDEQRDIS